MKSILLQLYDGELFPAEQYVPKITEYRRIHQEHYRHHKDFLDKLEPSVKEQFIRIMDEQLDAVPMEMSEMFIDGFRLGARMMIEIYQND